MEASQTVNLYITYVEKEGPFLKVWGQTEKNNSIYVEQFLLGASPQFDLGIGKVALENLQVGTLLCAKYKDNKYYRARITNVAFLQEGFVEVSFLDYGNKDLVPCGNIRSLQNFPSSFISIPPLATGFIFAEAHCPGGGEWNEIIFDNISKEIRYREVQCTLLIQATQYFLVKLFIGGNDLCGMLINRGLMQPISLQAQQAVLLSMSMQRQNVPPSQSTFPGSTGINTYKACTLEPGCQYPVYVSYVNDGPCHFSVQLKQSEEVLVMLMNDVNAITLRLLEDIPIPGTICLARCQEDGNVCRAVVTNEVDNQFKVFYVDFGNYEVVPLDALYQIPFKYVLPKVMAIRFSLAGVEKSTVTLEMRCAFKQFVDNRLLHMKVLPTPTRTAIPKCELWDPETKTSALDVVNRAAQNAYPEPISLNRGFSQPVKVSYVYSCNRFYVQLANKENDLLQLMLDLQASCQSNDPMDPNNIKVGLPCCALFESDQQWYRSQIVEVLGDSVKVRYIDYGNEEVVPVSQLKIIDGEQLTVLRPQAIECCLNGYQNMGEDLERDGILEELILEELFTMKVVEMTNKKALVELFDSSNYNVASLLLDKLAAAKSQVSPLLVQAGNKIEHRKSYSQNSPRDQNFRQDRRPGRDGKNYERSNDRNEKPWRQDNKDFHDAKNYDRSNDRNEKSWRQDNKDFRNHDKYSNENANERKSWRQNNKGFSPNSERQNNRDTSQNRNERFNKVNSIETTDNWGTKDKSAVESDDWNMPPPAAPSNIQQNSRGNDFGRSRGRFDNDKENWNSRGYKGSFKKKSDFRKDGSEVSSSGSENSFQRGPRTSSRNDKPRYQQKFDKPRSSSFNTSAAVNDSWNVSAVTTTLDAAPVTATFVPYDVVGTESKVIISWFHNPAHFYCQLADAQDQFKAMMEEIQQFYKSRKPELSVAGAPIIGLFPEDNVLYRAQVLEVIGSQYKVYYVDFGNVSTITKVWPIEKKFMNLPAQAIVCSLSGIGPPGDQWPDPDNYSKYLDKDAFTSKFVNKDEEKTYINLFYGDDDIAKTLIQEGLAVSIEQTIPEIEIPLLLGQQFRAIVKSINNLSDIIIALECGLALSCKMHNLETATETFEDTLKGLLEQTVIVYVDNVINNRLEVTLYDTEGSKLVIVNPDEGAYDSVEALCPLLVVRSTLTGYVSYADESSVYIQPVEYIEFVVNLVDLMFECYNDHKQDLPIIPEEGLLYAVHSQDGNWYRAKVISFDDEQATVLYIDYGNTEKVAFSELRELDDTFLAISALCLQVHVHATTDNLIDKDVIASISYGENGWEGTVEVQVPRESSATESAEERGEAVGMAAPQVIDEPAELKFIEETVAPEEIIPTETVTSTEEVAVSLTEIRPVKGTQVLVSHIDSPNEFYLQLAESLIAIDQLQLNLQEQVLEMPILETPAAGVLCAAPYSVDLQWYRAEVLDADDDITTVRFVDYGNTDVIDNKTTEIKTLPPNLLSLAVYATRSSLKVKSIDEEWNTNAMGRFEALANAEEITAEFIDQDEKTNYVELYSCGENIKDILIQENLALPVELSVDSKPTCFVSHLNSPSEFWIQLENCVDELEWIAEQLSGSEAFPELEDLTPGTLCAALFPDDDMWYRARILSNTVAGIELLFIDYGNSCMSSSLRQLPEDLVVTPPLAQKCSLQRPEGIPYWTPQAADKFNEISADGQTIFTVRKISTGETSVVQLLIDEKDVATMLLPTTEEGYVKDVESLESFHIEKKGEILPESYKLESMPGMTWDSESTKKFKELNSQDDMLFQIEFISEHTVRLYFDGNDIRTGLGGIKRASLNVFKTNAEEDLAQYETDDAVLNEASEYAAILDEQFNKAGDNSKNLEDNNTCIENKDSQKPPLNTSDLPFSEVGSNNEIDPVSCKSPVRGVVEEDTLLESEENAVKKEDSSSVKNDLSDNATDDIDKCTPVAVEENGENKNDASLNKSNSADIHMASLLHVKIDEAFDKREVSPERDSTEDNAILDVDRTISAGLLSPQQIRKTTGKLSAAVVSPRKINISNTRNEFTVVVPKEVVKKLDETAEDSLSEKCATDIKTNTVKVDLLPQQIEKTNENTVSAAVVSPKKANVSDTPKGSADTIVAPAEVVKKSNETAEDSLSDKCATDIKTYTDKVDLLPQHIEKTNDSTVSTAIVSPKKAIVNDTPKESDTIAAPAEVIKKLNETAGESLSEKCSTGIKSDVVKVGSLHDDATEEMLEKHPHIAPNSPKVGHRDESDNAHVAPLPHEEVKEALDTKDIQTSRPSSSCSGKIKRDDRILPSTVSRPHTPMDLDEDSKDVSVKGDLLIDDLETRSRPHSACSGKISYDERIVPAALSRPQSPIPLSDNGESQKVEERN